ncbi:hypothetical protein JKF63_05290 [Porcisia hertigi]|uniref:Core domain-containing protein n=1 Tax=Porcisia hertigi TaxID=2761500 RepID=A0A836LE18_9TRYP|nr:hypothetical protein JKF63_05290 [Porcisia hertigi]
MQRRLCTLCGGRVQIPQRMCIGSSAPYQQRLFHSTVTDVPGTTATAARGHDPTGTGASASAPSTRSSHAQPLYKSVHKGRGATPMPKPYEERKLRARGTPVVEAGKTPPADATAAPAASPLFGARSSCAEDVGPVPQRALSPLQKRQLQFRNKAAFVLTPQALRRVKYLLEHYSTARSAEAAKSPSTSDVAAEVPCGIRIGVRRRGCSGYSYTVNYYFDSAKRGDKAATPLQKMTDLAEDLVVEQDGVKVVVDANAHFYVIGTEMDYVVRNVEEKFTFKNPNQKYSCGCEESFMPFDADDMEE